MQKFIRLQRNGMYLLFLFIITTPFSLSQDNDHLVELNCNLEVSKINVNSRIGPPAEFYSEKRTAIFDIAYVNSNPELETAFNYAVDIWSSVVVSEVPITILVTFSELPPPLLGQCITNAKPLFNAVYNDTVWYPSSLANTIMGFDQNPGGYDMDIYFDNRANWYFGVDGNTPTSAIDFVTVALHEICHGLAYVSAGKVNAGLGSYGYITIMDIGRLPSFVFPSLHGKPTIYDIFIANESQQYFTDKNIFLNLSFELKEEFTSDNLYFYDANTFETNSQNTSKIFVPTNFQFGSSLLHLDEATYPPGNPNSLMTPYISYAEAIHNPGPITMNVLKVIGWSISLTSIEEENLISKFRLEQNYPNPFNSSTVINYVIPHTSKIRLSVINCLGQKIRELINEEKPAGRYSQILDFSNLVSGVYFITLETEQYATTRKMLLIR